VEELKLLPSEKFLGLFLTEKLVIKQKAKLAFEELASDKFILQGVR